MKLVDHVIRSPVISALQICNIINIKKFINKLKIVFVNKFTFW